MVKFVFQTFDQHQCNGQVKKIRLMMKVIVFCVCVLNISAFIHPINETITHFLVASQKKGLRINKVTMISCLETFNARYLQNCSWWAKQEKLRHM